MRFLRRITVIVPCLLFLLFELGCGDQYRPIANPIVSPGGQPQNTHYAYVLNYNPIGFGSTTQIDVSGDTNLQVLTTGYGSVYEIFQGAVDGRYLRGQPRRRFGQRVQPDRHATVINIGLVSRFAAGSLASTASTTDIRGEFRHQYRLPLHRFDQRDQHCLAGGHQHGVRRRQTRGRSCSSPAGAMSTWPTRETTRFRCTTRSAMSVSSTITQASGLHQNPVAMVASPDGAYILRGDTGQRQHSGRARHYQHRDQHHRRFRSGRNCSHFGLSRHLS